MTVDDKTSFDALTEKLDSLEKYHKERSFLSRLDMMFSVLVSLTLFLVGSFLTSLKPVDIVTKLGFSIFASLLVLLIYTLIGEFYAILTDHEILRFTYWMILLEGVFLLTILGAYSTMLLIPIEIALIIAYFVGLPIVVSIIFFNWFVESLYERYIEYLCYRIPRSRSKSNYLNPLLIGFIIMTTVTIGIFTSTMI